MDSDAPNILGGTIFICYIGAALLLTALIVLNLYKTSLRSPPRSTWNHVQQLSVFSVLAILSFATLSYHMLSFLITAYSNWAVARGLALPQGVLKNYLKRLHLWQWARTSTLFQDFATKICMESNGNWWWTENTLMFSMAWNIYMAVEGKLQGFVFIESDRVSSLPQDGWNHALEEVGFLARIAKGEPREEEEEGFRAGDKDLVLGIVPWAPVPAGPEAMEEYMNLAKERCGDEKVWKKIKGVRYLVQDKPSGLMLQPSFIESLKWLGNNGLAFDLGVDARNGGIWQLRETCEMLRLLHSNRRRGNMGEARLKIVINHLCKPDLYLTSEEIANGHQSYAKWRDYIEEMARFDGTFMKLSGAFSELPSSQDWQDPGSLERILGILRFWIDVIFDAFGPSRIMFGSDWPVCNVQGPGTELSWQYWHGVVEAILSARNLSDDEKTMIWSGTAQVAYNIP
ncbi:hypothetical protein GJ744_007156 [Endocarpon pusillum]|uniref:Amidohydrolase-related domain-containing protein n=1 Tax=Endocarpon pusillum TaxID=364733 RepID=A0A8H7ANB1_9EURO|nr:hypothetical protein GJ744_007156 [Endocarpon pusillum]